MDNNNEGTVNVRFFADQYGISRFTVLGWIRNGWIVPLVGNRRKNSPLVLHRLEAEALAAKFLSKLKQRERNKDHAREVASRRAERIALRHLADALGITFQTVRQYRQTHGMPIELGAAQEWIQNWTNQSKDRWNKFIETRRKIGEPARLASEACGITSGAVRLFQKKYGAPTPPVCFWLWHLSRKAERSRTLTAIRRDSKARQRATRRAWAERNREKTRAYMRARYKEYDSRPNRKLIKLLRSRIQKAVECQKTKRKHRTRDLIGCSAEHLRAHIESLFKPGMSWDNRGVRGWHLDHKKPLSSFDLDDPEQQKEANHWSNLQPLWWWENLSKGDRVAA